MVILLHAQFNHVIDFLRKSSMRHMAVGSLLALGIWQVSLAQIQVSRIPGVIVGIELQVGTHINRIGLWTQLNQQTEYLTGTASSRVLYQLNGLGPPGSRMECQLGLGLFAAFGPEIHGQDQTSFYGVLEGATHRQNQVGYVYRWYIDRIGTRQRTGTFLLGLNKFRLLFENDAFAVGIFDRFRTGAFVLTYDLQPNQRIGIRSIMWTGDPHSPGRRRINQSNYPSRHGYKNLSKAVFGRFSHGILAFTASLMDENRGSFHTSIGIDAEQVRHALQNRLIHDAITNP
ncbi:MAG: polymorphic toxin type 23 domain-containing protein, partial [Bacteroidota bacterium]